MKLMGLLSCKMHLSKQPVLAHLVQRNCIYCISYPFPQWMDPGESVCPAAALRSVCYSACSFGLPRPRWLINIPSGERNVIRAGGWANSALCCCLCVCVCVCVCCVCVVLCCAAASSDRGRGTGDGSQACALLANLERLQRPVAASAAS